MGITPLELGLAVLAVFVVFGPKQRPNFKKPAVQTVPQRNFNRAPAQFAAAQNAAARAMSPVAARRQGAHGAPETHQFAMAVSSGASPAPLPHELGFYS